LKQIEVVPKQGHNNKMKAGKREVMKMKHGTICYLIYPFEIVIYETFLSKGILNKRRRTN
jgi:hypothetical protein